MNIQRRTLFSTLRRTYFGSTLLALFIAAVALIVVMFLTLRAQQKENLELVARTIAYSTEAAVMFSDAETTTEIMTQVVEREHLIEASIFVPNPDDKSNAMRFVHYEYYPQSTMDRWGIALGNLILPEKTQADILYGQEVLGQVAIRGNSAVFIGFFLEIATVGLVCLVLAFFAARMLARRMERKIVSQLNALATLAYSARLNQDFPQRTTVEFDVVEFDHLGQNINAVLAEIQTHNQELLARQSALEQLALHDGLTGLPNRVYFGERLDRALLDARISGGSIGILYIDSDRFKEINDRYGHDIGDILLAELARRIRSAIRDSDVVARIGGDEFTVLLAPIRDVSDAIRVAEKILFALNATIKLENGTEIETGVSIGIACFPEHAADSEQLLRAADKAMYQAKQERGHYQMYNPALDYPSGGTDESEN